jgi:hypothetical protein
VDGFHALRRLHRQRGDCRDAVTIVRGKSFQVRGDARSGGRIKSGYRQYDWRRRVVVIRQSDGALRAKGSEENWTGCARGAREPASRNVRASPASSKKFYSECWRIVMRPPSGSGYWTARRCSELQILRTKSAQPALHGKNRGDGSVVSNFKSDLGSFGANEQGIRFPLADAS